MHGQLLTWRDFEAERVGRLQIDDEIEFGWLFDRDIARLCTTKYLVDKVGGASKQVREIRSIRHQRAGIDCFAETIHGRQTPATAAELMSNLLVLMNGVAQT
jgi:hypothetical protein